MATILRGTEVAEVLNARIEKKVEELKVRGVEPTLVTIRVGERDDDISYERGATRRAESVGVTVRNKVLLSTISQDELLRVIDDLNRDVSVHGVLLFRPLPKHIDETVVRNALAPEKDIDGITDLSLSGVFVGADTGYAPCTPQACMEILDHFDIEVKGKRAAVIGRSLVVGKPVALMLLDRDATVVLCHSRTFDLPAITRDADIIIACVGRAKMLGADSLSDGQIVIDVGINATEDGSLVGDVDYEAALDKVAAITPVPGGVGSVTTSVLIKNVVDAAWKTLSQQKSVEQK
jgi:methylenetetrahydrofolate dehydrogenase (NADP+)/methenyltetrahydrofolate cyclohydrolase